MKNQPKYPDFLCIGAQKSGTGWLYTNLRDDPEIYLTPIKELHYFTTRGQSLRRLSQEANWQNVFKHFRKRLLRQSPSNSWWLLRYLLLPRTDAWYASLFRSCGDRVAGDITPAYSILGPAEVAHVARLMPAAKIILILRDPVERAWSHPRMDRARVGWPFNHIGRAPNTEVPFELLQKHFDSEFATLRGDYPRMLGIWRSHFPAQQIFIGFSEEIEVDPMTFLDRVAVFLGVDPAAASGWPRAMRRVNAQARVPIPPEIARYLANKFLAGLRRLENDPLLPRVDYVRAWRQSAERYLAG